MSILTDDAANGKLNRVENGGAVAPPSR